MAISLADRGHLLYAGMREPEGRNAAAAATLRAHASALGGSIRPLALDPGDDASVEAAVAELLAETGGRIDVAVNNAGFGSIGLGEGFLPAQLAEILNVNVVGPQRVDRAVLPAMRERGAGLLIHLSSGIGRLVVPAMGVCEGDGGGQYP